MANSTTTINRQTPRVSPGSNLAVKSVLLAATLLCPRPSSSGEIRPVTSPNGRMRAYDVERGERRALMTEIWGGHPARTAQCPKAWAMWLLPVPQGPATRTATFSWMNWQDASSWIWGLCR